MAEFGRLWFVDRDALAAATAVIDPPGWATTVLPTVALCADAASAEAARGFCGKRGALVVTTIDEAIAAVASTAAEYWQLCARPCRDFAPATERLARDLAAEPADAIVADLIDQRVTGFDLSEHNGEARAALRAQPERGFVARRHVLTLLDGLAAPPDPEGLARALDAALPADADMRRSPLIAGVAFMTSQCPSGSADLWRARTAAALAGRVRDQVRNRRLDRRVAELEAALASRPPRPPSKSPHSLHWQRQATRATR